MNNVILIGRLTKDPEIRYANSGTEIARFTIAIDRRYKKEGEQRSDFVNCLAFGKTAEVMDKWFSKGNKIAIVGRIQTDSYENKEGQKVYTTDVIVENVDFIESKKDLNTTKNDNVVPERASTVGDGFMEIPNTADEGLPFA